VATVIAHELAHMWFGDLVTMAWWDDLWLNESFASWMGDKVSDRLYPELGLQVSEVRTTQGAMTIDALVSTGAIRKPIASVDTAFGSDLGLAYSKGSAVLGMVESWIGEKAFHKGIADYLEAHAWDNATGADLWTALSQASGRDVSGMLSSFLDQPGVPVVQVEFVSGGGVKLSQKRFLNYGVSAPPASWKIPVKIRYEAGGPHEKTVLLTEKGAVLKLGSKGTPDWIHPNAGEKGYYRWTLPDVSFDRLVGEASKRLTPRERVGLVLDLSALLRSGRLRGAGFLRLLSGLSSDEDPEVVSAVMEVLGGVKGAFVQTDLEESFAAYVRATLGPSLKRIGTARAPHEPEKVAELRPQLLGWLGEEGRDPEVLELARSMAAKYLESPASVDPELAGVALHLAALDGGRDLYESYKKRFESASSPDERRRLLAAMGSFRDDKLFDEALAYTLSGSLHVQEIFTVPFEGNSTEARRDRSFRWIRENYAALASRLPQEALAFLPYSAGGCSMPRLQEAEKFFAEPAHSPPGTEQELAKVAEAVKTCVALRQREGASVAEFLRSSSTSASR
jgi:aminopeptidase N